MVSSAGVSTPVISLAEAVTRKVTATATRGSGGEGSVRWEARGFFCLGPPGSRSIHGVNKGEADEGGTQNMVSGSYYFNLVFVPCIFLFPGSE